MQDAFLGYEIRAYSYLRICRTPPQKCPNQKVIVNGAQCSESNGKNNKKNSPIFIFRVIIENWGDFFGKMTLKWS